MTGAHFATDPFPFFIEYSSASKKHFGKAQTVSDLSALRLYNEDNVFGNTQSCLSIPAQEQIVNLEVIQ